ncbi:PD40 domain-containing protein [candidate division WOR-3 bacterium]|nr:PD40 domain-containing protein [candidate division WOR-3 bacterium]
MKRILYTFLIFLPLSGLIGQDDYDYEVFTVVDTLATNVNPGHLSPDGRTFICGLKDDDGYELLYQWQRRSLKASWKGPQLLTGQINEVVAEEDLQPQEGPDASIPGSYSNSQPTITDDGLNMIFVRNHNGLWEGNDLWMATRESSKAAFDNVRRIDELGSDSTAESYPFISANGKRLYYIADTVIVVSEFDENSGRFSKPEALKLPWDRDFISCWLSADELLFVAITYTNELFYAERTKIDLPFKEIRSLDLGLQGIFLASLSFDPKGDLYLYGSMSHEVDEPVIENKYPEDDYKEHYSETMILILTQSGGD